MVESTSPSPTIWQRWVRLPHLAALTATGLVTLFLGLALVLIGGNSELSTSPGVFFLIGGATTVSSVSALGSHPSPLKSSGTDSRGTRPNSRPAGKPRSTIARATPSLTPLRALQPSSPADLVQVDEAAPFSVSTTGDRIWSEFASTESGAMPVELVGPIATAPFFNAESCYPVGSAEPIRLAETEVQLAEVAVPGDGPGVGAAPHAGFDAPAVHGAPFATLTWLEAEALMPLPPHLRSAPISSEAMLGTEGVTGRSMAVSDANCATCSTDLADSANWQRCSQCRRSMCSPCLIRTLSREGRGWCSTCAAQEHLEPGSGDLLGTTNLG